MEPTDNVGRAAANPRAVAWTADGESSGGVDDAEYRSFDTTKAYREWCARHLPAWLGYGPAV